MTASKPQPKTLDTALLELQENLPKVKRLGNAQYGAYITLEDLTDAVFERLTEVGLSYVAVVQVHPLAGVPMLHCWLTHATTGQAKEGDWPLPDTTDPQRLGSAITYARRYMLTALTGVVADKDDDGAAAKKVDRDWVAQAKKITDHAEMQRLWTAARAGGASGAELEEIAALGQKLAPKDEKGETDGGGQADGKSDPA